jgi:hypothetical protein
MADEIKEANMDLSREFSIETRGEFLSLLRSLKRAVDEGEMLQVNKTDKDVDITSLSETGPWPDCIELSFKITSTGDEYTLTVETYHGAGGHWKRK